jgi:hypothetical protein
MQCSRRAAAGQPGSMHGSVPGPTQSVLTPLQSACDGRVVNMPHGPPAAVGIGAPENRGPLSTAERPAGPRRGTLQSAAARRRQPRARCPRGCSPLAPGRCRAERQIATSFVRAKRATGSPRPGFVCVLSARRVCQ